MCYDLNSRAKPHLNIGTIGHVDHGKTTLTAAITKILAESGTSKAVAFDQIDKAPEEKARGITINATHGAMMIRHHDGLTTARIGLRNPMAGSRLTVSATPCRSQGQAHASPTAQGHDTRTVDSGHSHIHLQAPLFTTHQGWSQLVEMEVRDLLNFYKFPGDDVPIIRGSALCALKGDLPEMGRDSILRLMAAVDTYFPVGGVL
ncbi:MAG: hypothetical protein WDW38_007121 [Sanguina aurantia]